MMEFFFSSRRRHTRLVSDWSRRVLFRSHPRGAHRLGGRWPQRGGLGLVELRSEERRVGKAWRYRWAAGRQKKKMAGAGEGVAHQEQEDRMRRRGGKDRDEVTRSASCRDQ